MSAFWKEFLESQGYEVQAYLPQKQVAKIAKAGNAYVKVSVTAAYDDNPPTWAQFLLDIEQQMMFNGGAEKEAPAATDNDPFHGLLGEFGLMSYEQGSDGERVVIIREVDKALDPGEESPRLEMDYEELAGLSIDELRARLAIFVEPAGEMEEAA